MSNGLIQTRESTLFIVSRHQRMTKMNPFAATKVTATEVHDSLGVVEIMADNTSREG